VVKRKNPENICNKRENTSAATTGGGSTAAGSSGISTGAGEAGSLVIKEECWCRLTVVHTATKPSSTGTPAKWQWSNNHL